MEMGSETPLCGDPGPSASGFRSRSTNDGSGMPEEAEKSRSAAVIPPGGRSPAHMGLLERVATSRCGARPVAFFSHTFWGGDPTIQPRTSLMQGPAKMTERPKNGKQIYNNILFRHFFPKPVLFHCQSPLCMPAHHIA